MLLKKIYVGAISIMFGVVGSIVTLDIEPSITPHKDARGPVLSLGSNIIQELNNKARESIDAKMKAEFKEILRIEEEKKAKLPKIFSYNANHGMYFLTNSEKEQLARLVECEAGAEDLFGKVAVAQTVLNRIVSKEYPNTLYEVIHQPYQFEPVLTGVYNRKTPSEDCYYAVELALMGANPIDDCVMFWAKYVRKGHPVWDTPVRKSHGVHVFAGRIKW